MKREPYLCISSLIYALKAGGIPGERADLGDACDPSKFVGFPSWKFLVF